MKDAPPIAIVETPEFLSTASRLLSDEERAALIDFLAYNPMAGALISGAGGIRKLRWGMEGRGKRGGARVIYFYYNANLPLFMLAAYAKNEQANLSQTDKSDFKRLTRLLVENYRRSKA
ncbi:MAG TPA: type II toxin-antitoxin system RelE/ParE family toxin [Alphaproteobacteria bacterium]|nr:type II toxin-antitoxin system RelE/ParE family toxin [Alphaproteobacteria bacterium]